MRALVMDFSADTAVNNIGDQFMLGPSLLVNPVYEYQARKRHVYLPGGTGWYNFYTGGYENGGQHLEADAPYNRLPLYLKAGTILPLGPERRYVAERKADTLQLYVYGGADGSFTLYEDEGRDYSYEKGSYSEIPFTWQDSTHTLAVGKRTGSYAGMLPKRTIQFVYIDKAHPQGIADKVTILKTITYTGTAVQLSLAYKVL
jgi:alpha-D-xyloside xylohydrolase